MGQYYTLSCPQTGTHVDAHAMGAFVKAYEQVWSSSQPAMLAYLTSAGRGSHPRDLPWAPEGLWAGRVPLMVGDYAEDGDLIGCPQAFATSESDVYGACKDSQIRLDAKAAKRKACKDLSGALIPIFERSHGLRCSKLRQDGKEVEGKGYSLPEFFPVRQTATGWEVDLSDVDQQDRKQTMEYYERMGINQNTAWQRAAIEIRSDQHFTPLAAVPDHIPGADEGLGGRMIWVNLDRREFVDPAVIGDDPDLVGVMKGDSARAVLAMLVHRERRGGGDLGDLGPVAVAGRWRGDRIVLLGTGSFRPGKGKDITQEEVLANFSDVSGNAVAFIRCDEYFGRENFEIEGQARTIPEAGEHEIIAIAARNLPLEITTDKTITIEITPGMTIAASLPGRKQIQAPLRLAATVDIYADGGKVFLNQEIRREMDKILVGLPQRVLSLKLASPGLQATVICPGDFKLERSFSSMHERISLCRPAAA